MENELRNELKKLKLASYNLIWNDDQREPIMRFFHILIRLRVLYGYNVFGEFKSGFGMINEKEHHLIILSWDSKRILYKNKNRLDNSSPKYMCFLKNNKYAKDLPCYEVTAAQRILTGINFPYRLEKYLKEFQSYDETMYANKISRKSKINKMNWASLKEV